MHLVSLMRLHLVTPEHIGLKEQMFFIGYDSRESRLKVTVGLDTAISSVRTFEGSSPRCNSDHAALRAPNGGNQRRKNNRSG